MTDPKKYRETDRDLTADFDESKLDRVGKPIDVEQHDAGRAEVGDATHAKESHTLSDMAADYEFFCTGVIHATTPFDRDPVAEFNRAYPTTVRAELPVAIDYSEPFFQGLGVCLVAGHPVNLDHRIYAIIRERWEQLRDMIAGMAIMGRKHNFYGRLNFYEMRLVDPFALKKMVVVDHVPTVPLTVFGVSSNKSFSYLELNDYPKRPFLKQEPPKDDVKTEGDAVLGPPPSPEHLLLRNKEQE